MSEPVAQMRCCPNCGGEEWFPGAACWDCGWESNPDEQGHAWSEKSGGVRPSRQEKLGVEYPFCLRCGVVKRRDGKNSECKGVMPKVGPRDEASRGAGQRGEGTNG